ncbi:MAG: hypothetical protein WBK26_08190 [Burkholderiaceae bacterium]
MKTAHLGSVIAGLAVVATAHAQSIDTSGYLRTSWAARQAAHTGPLAQANALVPGFVATEPSAATVQAELRANAKWGGVGVNTTITLQGQRPEGGSGGTQAWVNEAVVNGTLGSGAAPGLQWSAGKKVVSWDVCHAFRPNDVVQQEARRTLTPATLEGRPLLMLEHFTASTAYSVVWVNPTQARAATGVNEPALAARVYHRAGAVDWHGFARHGVRTGTSLGAAASWVASDALELHASVRRFQRNDGLAWSSAAAESGGALLPKNPWGASMGGSGSQALVGGTWTAENQLSLLAEAWYDGTALPKAAWQQWATRNQALGALAGRGAPATAMAGNLAWQSGAFNASGATASLHRQNLYARLSWTHEAWQPALDVLYHPADGGRMVTASLVWQGDRVKLEGGLRVNAGPTRAVVRQLPVQQQGYVMGTWAF